MIPLLKSVLPLLKSQLPYLLMLRAYVSSLATISEYTIANEDGVITARERRRILLAAGLTEWQLPRVVTRSVRYCLRPLGRAQWW